MIEKITMKEWLSRRVPKVKSSSLKTYRSYERAHILPSLGNIPISEVGAMLPAFSVQLAERLAHKTVRDILTYVHTILREAEAKGLAEASNMPKITMEPKEKEVLTYSEQKALTARLRQSAAPLDMAVLLALATGRIPGGGARPAALCAWARWPACGTKTSIWRPPSCGCGATASASMTAMTATPPLRIPRPKPGAAGGTSPCPEPLSQYWPDTWKTARGNQPPRPSSPRRAAAPTIRAPSSAASIS